jgi:carboxypeptidase C (cathepsin A)
VPAIAHYL